MALFENYERRIDQINAALAKYDIKSIEEANLYLNLQDLHLLKDHLQRMQIGYDHKQFVRIILSLQC